jgi:drug/metabolite transporter (DMT)-like permease
VKATLYCYTYPIWATLIAWVLLREKPAKREILALAVAMAGVALTTDINPTRGHSNFYELVGLSAGMMSGAAITSIRNLHKTDQSEWIVFFFSLVICVATGPISAGELRAATWLDFSVLCSIAILALIAQLLMTISYSILSAIEGSLLSLFIVPLSAIFAIVFLKELPQPKFWIGALLVLLAMVLLALKQSVTRAPDQPESLLP